MEFERFEDGVHKIVNCEGICFRIGFVQSERLYHNIIFVSGCESINEKNDCHCDMQDEQCKLDSENVCERSYDDINYLTNHEESFKILIEKIVKKINCLKRCANCTKIFKKFKDVDTCGQCAIQELIDQSSEKLGTCVCCENPIFKRNRSVLICQHQFHKKCIHKWENDNCPLCRGPKEFQLTTDPNLKSTNS